MKRYLIAAGALLIGTSALALSADKAPVPADAEAAEAAIADKPFDAKLETAAKDEGKIEPTADMAAEIPVEPKAGALALAEAPAVASGVKDPTMTATLTARPALENYPPCDPGPGDDNCIQLYEPGVRVALASWNRPTGGLAEHSVTDAMGGPYESVESADAKPAMSETEIVSADKPEPANGATGGPYEPVEAGAEIAMNGDGVVDPAAGETATLEEAAHAAHQGMGGPIEAQSGYPPCEPGPGDDRCIQLYERGVTGAGN